VLYNKKLFYVLFFFSGASALIYQVVWIRMFGLVFGVSAFAMATVLVAFMSGLGVGNFYFGKVADRSDDPVRLYAALEFGIGLFGLIFPFLYSALRFLCAHMPDGIQGSFLKLSASRFVLSLLVLAIPTTLMGGTLPVLSKIFVRDLRTIGKKVGGLYSVNNAGAIAGCLAAGFILIMLLGVHGTIYVAAGVNIAVALVAWRMRLISTVKERAGGTGQTVVIPRAQNQVTFPKRIVRLVLILIGVEGFVSLAYELVWTRILSAAVLGNSVYSFCIVTAVFILGLTLGSLIVAAIIDKRKDLVGFFGLVEIAIGLSAVAFLAIFCAFPGLSTSPHLHTVSAALGRTMGKDLFFSIAIMLVPATLMGMAFPTAVKICTSKIEGAAQRVGVVGGVNIVGSILGSFAGGFILISLFGMYRTVFILALVNVAAGCAALMIDPLLQRLFRFAIVAALAAACFLIAAGLPHHALFWRSTTVSRENEQLSYYVEDYAATVSVVNAQSIEGPVKTLAVDGIPVAGSDFMLRTTQKVQAHIPLLLYESQNHGRAHTVLAVGLGSGGTSWSAMQHTKSSITCVELVPGVAAAAKREFAAENHAVFDSARYHLIFGDGRNHVFATKKRYDVILTESVHPVFAGNASLYTQDYFATCRQRLTENGVFSVWLPIYRISRDDFRTVMATFQSVFPFATVWFTANSLSRQVLLIGTMKKLHLDYATWCARALDPGVLKDLKEVRLDDPAKLLDCMIMSEDDIRDFSAGAAVHTDNHPRLEFSSPKSADDFTTWKQNLAAIIPYKRNRFDVLVNCSDSSQALQALQRYDSSGSHILNGIVNHFDNQEVALREYRIAQGLNPADSSIGYLAKQELLSMQEKVNGLRLAGKIREAGIASGMMLSADPDDFEIVREAALWYARMHMVDTAEALLLGFAKSHPHRADVYTSRGIVFVNNQQWDRAIAVLDSALLLCPGCAEAYNTRAIAFAGKGLYADALSSLDKAIELDPKTPNVQENRAYVYRRAQEKR